MSAPILSTSPFSECPVKWRPARLPLLLLACLALLLLPQRRAHAAAYTPALVITNWSPLIAVGESTSTYVYDPAFTWITANSVTHTWTGSGQVCTSDWTQGPYVTGANFLTVTPGVFDYTVVVDWSNHYLNIGLDPADCRTTNVLPAAFTVVAVTNVTASTNHVAVGGDTVTLTAHMTPIAAGELVTWEVVSGNAVLNPTTGMVTEAYSASGGVVVIRATCGTSFAEATINVYEVTGVSATPSLVAVGDPVEFTATMIPSDNPAMLHWSVTNGTIVSQDGMSITVSNSSAGDVAATVECGASAATAAATAVGVKRIAYYYPFTGETGTNGGPAYVRKGDPVLFTAIPDPETATFPANKPIWGGTSGASGSTPTISVRFNALSSSASDAKTVTATCGTTSVTNQSVVFSTTLTMVADDNFTGRAALKFGIGEDVNLTNNLVPIDLSPDAVGITFETVGTDVPPLSNAGGRASHISDFYDEGAYAVSLVWKGKELDKKDFSFVVPTDAEYEPLSQLEPVPNTINQFYGGALTWHQSNSVTAGRHLWVWIKPSDVSFYKLIYLEGVAPYRPFGGISQIPGYQPTNHPQSPFPLTKGIPNRGSRSVNVDTSSWILGSPPIAYLSPPGGEELTMPIGYAVPSMSQTNWFGSVDFKAAYDVTGKCTIWKQSTNKVWSAEYSAPSSGFLFPQGP